MWQLPRREGGTRPPPLRTSYSSECEHSFAVVVLETKPFLCRSPAPIGSPPPPASLSKLSLSPHPDPGPLHLGEQSFISLPRNHTSASGVLSTNNIYYKGQEDFRAVGRWYLWCLGISTNPGFHLLALSSLPTYWSMRKSQTHHRAC